MRKEKKFLKLLFVFCVFIFIADRIDDYLLRKEIKKFMFEEGGFELTENYKCEEIKYGEYKWVNRILYKDPTGYLPTAGVYCLHSEITVLEPWSRFLRARWFNDISIKPEFVEKIADTGNTWE